VQAPAALLRFLQYTKYCCKPAPYQNAKFLRKLLLPNYPVKPFCCVE